MIPSKAQIERRVEAFVQACRRGDLKITHQRTEIFRELARSADHPDAEALFASIRKRIPAISRDTVYRTLALLEGRGLIRRVDVLCERARFDARLQPHHHFVCRRCGLVRDFASKTLDGFTPPRRVRSWGEVEYAQVQLRGICVACKGKKRGGPSGR
jgi:Fur family peroxide stress response transcriptional regulator